MNTQIRPRRPGKDPMKHVPGPDEPGPDPELQRMVRHALGLKDPKPDTHPEGLTDMGTMPELKMPPPTVLVKERPPDELEPAFGDIERVTQAALMRMLPQWLAVRLSKEWPRIPPAAWHKRLWPFMAEASYFFRQSRYEGCALAYVTHDQFGDTGFIEVVFNVGREADCYQLFRDMIRWGKTFGTPEIRHIEHCDVKPGKLAELQGFERREEFIVKVK